MKFHCRLRRGQSRPSNRTGIPAHEVRQRKKLNMEGRSEGTIATSKTISKTPVDYETEKRAIAEIRGINTALLPTEYIHSRSKTKILTTTGFYIS